MPLLFLCKSFDLISEAARLKLASNTMTVEQILIFIFSVFFFSSEFMPGLLLSLSTSDFYITVDDRSPLTSHLSPLTSVCWLAELLLTVRAEISDWAPPQSRPDPAPGPADVRWPDRHQGSALRSTTGEERERERQKVNMKFLIHRSLNGDGRSSVTYDNGGIYMHFNLN